MAREHRIVSALVASPVPVAPVLGFCDDTDITGAPFYVMGFVEGAIVRTSGDAETLSVEQRQTASESIADVLSKLHALEPAAAGLGDLGRPDGYIERQLKRWRSQYESMKTQEIPAIDEVADGLHRRVPEQARTAIVHGDYRLDNAVLGPTGAITAVLDWEICTLGDPLADLGLLWVYWSDPDQAAVLPQASPTALEGFPRKAELIERYAAGSQRDLSQLDYYIAFGYWKLTCIIAGVYARYAGGAMGDVPADQVQGFRSMLDALSDMTVTAADGIG